MLQEELVAQQDKDIDKHLEMLVNQILILKTELDILKDWYINEWKLICNKIEKKFKTNMVKKRSSWIQKYIFEPKRYQYTVYVRAFLDKLYVYLKKGHRDHKKNVNMWESSKYLKYYIDLIFYAKPFSDYVYKNEDEVLKELSNLISFLSNPLHGFSNYFNKVYVPDDKVNETDKIEKVLQEKINYIVDLILKRNINEDVIKCPINDRNNEQNYLDYTRYKVLDNCEMKNFLQFLKKNFLKEFNEVINNLKMKRV